MLYIFDHFTIFETPSGEFFVSGSIYYAEQAFKSIHRRPPNKYGNFYGRKKAGFAACREIIEKFPHTKEA